jgi:uncharacterized damage-inducible protein DinB
MNSDKALRQHLIQLLKGGEAHVTFEDAIKGLAAEQRGTRPDGAEHSAWDLLEHLRIAQRDILEFSRNAQHKSPKWPEGYWPAKPAPANDEAWEASVEEFRGDLDAMCELVLSEETDLFAKIPHGDGQTILREALLTADHNAYHVGQLVLVRQLLGAWK